MALELIGMAADSLSNNDSNEDVPFQLVSQIEKDKLKQKAPEDSSDSFEQKDEIASELYKIMEQHYDDYKMELEMEEQKFLKTKMKVRQTLP